MNAIYKVKCKQIFGFHEFLGPESSEQNVNSTGFFGYECGAVLFNVPYCVSVCQTLTICTYLHDKLHFKVHVVSLVTLKEVYQKISSTSQLNTLPPIHHVFATKDYFGHKNYFTHFSLHFLVYNIFAIFHERSNVGLFGRTDDYDQSN